MGSVLRWLRALTLASVLVTTGVAGHAAADGAVPAPLLLAVLFVGATFVLAPVLGSPASPLRVALLVVGGQAILHVCLWLLATNPTGRSGAGVVMPEGSAGFSSMPAGMVHGSAASGVASLAWVGNVHLGMLLAHLVAGLFLGLWLAAGERAAWTLLRLAARPVAEALVILLNAATALAAVRVGWARGCLTPGWARERVTGSPACTVHCLSRRGPPRVSVA